MRAGLGDTGRVRVTVEFQQRTLPPADGGDAPAADNLVLETLVEYEERVLDRAQVALYGSGTPKRLMVARDGDEYAYSIDRGERWGRMLARPRIFDLAEFEAELAHISVEDATVDVLTAAEASGEAAPGDPPGGDDEQPVEERFVDALDVSLERDAFLRLLGIFAGDVEGDEEPAHLNAFSVSLEAGDDVALHYWWSLSDTASAGDPPQRVRCSVSIRVATPGVVEPAAIALDPSLPPVSDIDGVWAIVRREVQGAGGSAAP
jgi:hypothetical protein